MGDFVHQDEFIMLKMVFKMFFLEVADQLKCALAQVTFVKPREEL